MITEEKPYEKKSKLKNNHNNNASVGKVKNKDKVPRHQYKKEEYKFIIFIILCWI